MKSFCRSLTLILSTLPALCGYAAGVGGGDGFVLAETGKISDLQKLRTAWPASDPRAWAARFLLDNLNNKFSVFDNERLERQLHVMDSVYAASTNTTKAADQTIIDQNSKSRPSGAGPRVVPDRDMLSPDSLRRTIDEALATWNRAPWHDKYTFAQFLEYVLPYRVADEPLEYYWREDCRARYYKGLAPSDGALSADVLKLAAAVNDRIDFRVTQALSGAGLQGYTFGKRSNTGKCDDRAVLTVMAMRAGGIPAAYEFIPAWGSINNGHSFCSVIAPDGRAMAFHSVGDDGRNEYFERKVPKIYRRVFSVQDTTIIYKYRDTEDVPQLFANCDLVDATASHTVKVRDLQVDIPGGGAGLSNNGVDIPGRGASVPSRGANKIAYLAVFSAYGRWMPIAYAANRGGATVFRDMGTGFSTSGAKQGTPLDENIGAGMLYLPCFYRDGEVVAAADPVVLSKDTTYTIRPVAGKYETVTLARKFPRVGHIVEYAALTAGGVFEGANKPDFSDATELYYIAWTPLSRMQKVEVVRATAETVAGAGAGTALVVGPSPSAFRYVRYRKPANFFSLAEMKFYNKEGRQLSGKMITCVAFDGNPDARLVMDGDPLTYFALPVVDGWIGLDLERPENIATIEFCPRTDDNDISPGDTYQLFWWNGQWTGLGVQKATDYELTFDNVPSGALLWLRDMTRGREERPFTYSDGKQIWW